VMWSPSWIEPWWFSRRVSTHVTGRPPITLLANSERAMFERQKIFDPKPPPMSGATHRTRAVFTLFRVPEAPPAGQAIGERVVGMSTPVKTASGPASSPAGGAGRRMRRAPRSRARPPPQHPGKWQGWLRRWRRGVWGQCGAGVRRTPGPIPSAISRLTRNQRMQSWRTSRVRRDPDWLRCLSGAPSGGRVPSGGSWRCRCTATGFSRGLPPPRS
jgi:hypothetical protein